MIVNADCLEFLPRLPAGVFDFVVVDSPYNAKMGFENDDMARDDFLKFTTRNRKGNRDFGGKDG